MNDNDTLNRNHRRYLRNLILSHKDRIIRADIRAASAKFMWQHSESYRNAWDNRETDPRHWALEFEHMNKTISSVLANIKVRSVDKDGKKIEVRAMLHIPSEEPNDEGYWIHSDNAITYDFKYCTTKREQQYQGTAKTLRFCYLMWEELRNRPAGTKGITVREQILQAM